MPRRTIFVASAVLLLCLATGQAFAQVTPSNCKTIQGDGYFAQACGDNAQVTGGPGGTTASTGTQPVPTVSASPAALTALPVVPVVPVVPVPSPQATQAASPTIPRPQPMGLIGALLRLLGLA